MDAPDSPDSRWTASTRVIVVSTVGDVAFWMMVPLLSLRLLEQGVEPVSIGLFAGLPWLVVLLGAPAAPWIIQAIGSASALRLSIAIQGVAVLVFASTESFSLLCVANALLGVSYGIGWVVADSWICAAAEQSRRGRSLGLYEAFTGASMGLGPLVLLAVGTSGTVPFLVALALGGLAMCAALGLEDERAMSVKRLSLRDIERYVRRCPAVFLLALLYGALDDASMTLLPVHAVGSGHGDRFAALLASIMGFGSLALVYGIGALCDRLGYRKLQCATGALLVLCLAAMSILGTHALPLLAVVLLWGGLVASLNTTALVEASATVQPGELVGVVSMVMVASTMGSAIGPAAAGYGMALAPASGLFGVMLGFVAAVGALVAFIRLRADPPSGVSEPQRLPA